MRILANDLNASPPALANFSFNTRDLMRSRCRHCTTLAVARELDLPGLRELLAEHFVAPTGLPIKYGMKYESDLEAELERNLGDLVRAPIDGKPESTIALMASGVPVIYQGVLRGGSASAQFSGRPDFLVRADYQLEFGDTGLTATRAINTLPETTADPGYLAWDAKLSASTKPEHLMQLGLYVDALAAVEFLGVGKHGLVLGSRELAGYTDTEVLAAMAEARRVMLDDIEQALSVTSYAELGPLHCTASSFCDSCEYPSLCDAERRRIEHLALVSNINRNQIEALNAVGVHTVSQLAEFSGSLNEVSDFVIDRLSRQARVQLPALQGEPPSFEVLDAAALDELPEPDSGDWFFDLEGFSFFEESGGLEYLFGWVGHGSLSADDEASEAPKFEWLWADNRDLEKQIFEQFVAAALRQLSEHPQMRIYHYANYEVAALKRLAQRHNSLIAEVDYLCDEVLIDLYRVVKAGLVIGQESYSIKKLETYYTFARSSEVLEAMGSMDYYDQYRELIQLGDAESMASAEKLKRQVLDYNRDDCVSTLALYRWLSQLKTR